jgi:hypothetical protein
MGLLYLFIVYRQYMPLPLQFTCMRESKIIQGMSYISILALKEKKKEAV